MEAEDREEMKETKHQPHSKNNTKIILTVGMTLHTLPNVQ